jgi:hypothetical protein
VKDNSYWNWKQFESTGRIEDYLNYKMSNDLTGKNINEDFSLREQELNPYAGTGLRDGNGVETAAGGRVRQEDNTPYQRTW